MLKKNTITSLTKKWYEIREKKISATNISTIIGVNNFKTKLELLNDKVHGLDKIENIYTKHGNKFEEIAIDILEKKFNIIIDDIGFKLSDKYDFLGATPDGITIYNNNISLVEIKCPLTRKINGLPSLNYYCQMQTQMEVFDVENCIFFECDIEEITKLEYKNTDKKNCGYYRKKNIYWKLNESSLNIVNRDRYFFEYFFDDINQFNNNLKIKLKQKKDKLNRKRKFSEVKSLSPRPNKYQRNNEGMKIRSKKKLILTKQYLNHYIEKDKCEVWLKFYGRKYYNEYCVDNKFSKEILHRSIELKKKFIEKIKKICKMENLSYIVIPYNFELNKYLLEFTKIQMEKNIDVIINPYLYDENLELFSNPTIIVKDYSIQKIFPNVKHENKDYYILINRVIKNIKYINFGENLSNNTINRSFIKKNNFDHYVLNKNQKNINYKSYIIGNKWNYMDNAKKIESTEKNDFSKLGVINFSHRETRKIIYKYKNWLQDIISNDDKYIIFNDKSYTPNYNTNEQSNWLDFKKSILEQNNDLVLIYGIGKKNKKLFHNDNIYDWKDPKFLKNIKKDKYNLGENKCNIIKNILELNNSEKLIYPTILSQQTKQILRKNDLEIYCDFETVNCFLGKENLVYLIGMSIKYKDEEISYEYFFADKEDSESEKKIFDDFIDRINELEEKYDCNATIYCWSKAEYSFLKNFNKKNNFKYEIYFTDLLEIFKSNCILIKNNIYGFGLKNYVKSMYNHNMIELNYKSECDSGDKSIISALNYYNKNDIDEYWNLIKYNEIDCTIMYEILTYIRNYYKIN
jgi:putative phage-type endonuclease